MNKLSALLAQKVGKESSKYEEIANATYGTQSAEEEQLEEDTSPSTGIYRMSSSTITGKPSIFGYLRQHIASVIIVILLTIIFALAGERASSVQEAADLVEDKASTSAIKWRPCQLYLDSHTDVKVLQTSLGDPSNQWGEVPCLVRNTRRIPYSKIYEDRQWSWLFGHGNPTTPIEYGSPSAVIKTNFQNIAHPKRDPIIGFGGAFTEATALNYLSLDTDGKNAILELLFGKDGLGYSLGRVPINSCDFSVESYSFDAVVDDFPLDNFDMKVEHDVMSGMVELLLQADGTLKDAWPGDSLNVMASPWSPPAWMKKPTYKDPPGSTHAVNMTGSAEPNCLREGTGPESRYAKSWALYFSKFLSAYKSWGIELFAVTVQNEPEFPAPWEACAYTPSIEADFIANHLGPTLEKDHPDVKLLIFDHNKDHAVKWGGMDRLLDGAVGQANMHRFVSMLKYQNVSDDHLLLGSEACHCPSTGYAGGDLNVAWARAERYAHTILSDLAAGSQGWVEWNMVLDSIGGPNHLGNMCDAPLLAVPYRVGGKHNVSELPYFEQSDHPFGPVAGDARTREELHAMGMPAEYLDRGVVVQPMYYYMGHISRHVRPGSRAVKALVDHTESDTASRTFRQNSGDSFIAGGGINNLSRAGVEVTLWPCEGSTRQEWAINEKGQFAVFGHDWLGAPTTSCVGKIPDESFHGLLLTDCDDTAGSFRTMALNETLSTINIMGNGGATGARGGAQITIGKCAAKSNTGELISSFFANEGGDTCVTTGWPFLQVGAFVDKEGTNRTMIVLNEASEPANYILRGDDGEILMTNSIPSHSIQTIIL
eukprot:scaffold164_cov266-Chaetoceros_neogracile.AAC.24